MSLSTTIQKSVPSSYTVTGGTVLPLTVVNAAGPLRLAVTADTNFVQRRTYEFVHSDPRPAKGAPNGYSQERFKGLLKWPKVLANSNLTVDTATFQFAWDVETSDAEKTAMLDAMAQLFMDSDLRTAVKAGTTA